MQCLPKKFTGKRDKFYGRAGYVDDPLLNIATKQNWFAHALTSFSRVDVRVFDLDDVFRDFGGSNPGFLPLTSTILPFRSELVVSYYVVFA